MGNRLFIGYFLIILVTSQATLLQSNIFAQQSTSNTIKIESKGNDLSEEVNPQDELLLKYVEFFSDEAEKHRKDIYKIFSYLSIAVGILIFLLGFLHWRSHREIKATVDDFFKREIEEQFKMKLNDLETSVSRFKTLTRDSRRYFKSLSRALLVTSDIGNEENPFDERKLSGKEILWVDDKQYNITDYKLLLQNLGVIVTPAETTADTIKHLNSKQFDLIITNMGRENDGGEKAGLDLLKEIKTVQIPKVIFTRPDKRDQYKQDVEGLGVRKVVSGFLGILKEIVDILAR